MHLAIASMNYHSDKIITNPGIVRDYDPRGLGWFLYERMLNYGDKIALMEGTTLTNHTYRDLVEKIARVASGLQEIGIKPQDVAIICDYNRFEDTILYLACLFMGALPVAFDPSISYQDAAIFLKKFEPKIVFILPTVLDTIRKAFGEIDSNAEIVIIGDHKNQGEYRTFASFLSQVNDFQPIACKSVQDVALICLSSGTSGTQKPIYLTHYHLMCQIQNIRDLIPLDRFLQFSSLVWGSQVLATLAGLQHGDCKITATALHPETFWKYIEDTKPTYVLTSPWQVALLLNVTRPANSAKSLKMIAITGSRISRDQIVAFQRLVPETVVTSVYGMSEISGMPAMFNTGNPMDLDLLKETPESIGRVTPGYSLKIVDPNTGEILGANQEGEIRLKTEMVLSRTLNTVDCFDSDGWFKTGDIGYYDNKKRLFITERLKEMIRYRSWIVPPSVVEEMLLKHPNIADAIVFGVPHKIDGDRAAAFVVLKNPKQPTAIDDIEHFMEKVIYDDRYKLRGGINIVEKIPRTATGKPLRRIAREMSLQLG